MDDPRYHSLINTRDAAERLGVSRRTLETMRQRGTGPAYIKLGHRVLYNPAQIDVWVTSLSVTSTAEAKRLGNAEADPGSYKVRSAGAEQSK